MKRLAPSATIFIIALLGVYAMWAFFAMDDDERLPGAHEATATERFESACVEFARLSTEWADLHFSVTDRESADAAAPAMRKVETRMRGMLDDLRRLRVSLGDKLDDGLPAQAEAAMRFVRLNGVILKSNSMRFLAAQPEAWFGSKTLRDVCIESSVRPNEQMPLPELMGIRAAGCTATTLVFTKRVQEALAAVTNKEQADAAAPVVRKAAHAFLIRNSEAETVRKYQDRATDAEKAELKQTMLDCLSDVEQSAAEPDTQPLKEQINRLRQSSPAYYGSEPLQQAIEGFLTATGEGFFGKG